MSSRSAVLATTRSRSLTLRDGLFLLTLVVGTGIACALFFARLDDLSNYNGDENLWIYTGHNAFELFFVQHAFTHPFWQEPYGSWGSLNPQVGKYVIGLGTHSGGYREVPLRMYSFSHSPEWNRTHDLLLDAGLVRAARLPVAAAGVLGCLVLCGLVTMVLGRWEGISAAAIIVGSGLLLELSRTATTDAPAFCFGLLTVCGLVGLVRSIRGGRDGCVLGWSAATGLTCGLAVSTKLNTMLVALVCALVLLMEYMRQHRDEHRRLRTLAAMLLVFCIAIGIFFGSNPLLYAHPFDGLRQMLRLSEFVGGLPDSRSTPSLGARVAAVWRSNRYFAPLAQFGLPGDRLLLGFGGGALAATAWRSPQSFVARDLDVISIWIIVTYVGVTLWLPHDWSRYYLPLQACNAFLQVYGIAWLVRLHATQGAQ